MAEPVILVSGFGRCGSSLVMQMLDAGGVSTVGYYPAYEDDRTGLARDPEWISQQRGKALKLLNPHYPHGRLVPGDYRIIWLDRDHRQQSRSQAKFARLLMGLPIDRNGTRLLAKSYGTDLPLALEILTARGPILRLRFEYILADPAGAAQHIRQHTGVGRVADMADQVRARPPECAPGMDMELSLIAQHEQASHFKPVEPGQ